MQINKRREKVKQTYISLFINLGLGVVAIIPFGFMQIGLEGMDFIGFANRIFLIAIGLFYLIIVIWVNYCRYNKIQDEVSNILLYVVINAVAFVLPFAIMHIYFWLQRIKPKLPAELVKNLPKE